MSTFNLVFFCKLASWVFKLLLHKKAEKEQKLLKVVQLVLKPKLFLGWTCLKAGLVSGPHMSRGWTCSSTLGLDLSQGWTCLRAGLVLGPDLSKNFRAGSVQKL